MRVSHAPVAIDYAFDDPNLLGAAGLVPVMALAERAGLHTLLGQHLTLPGGAGAFASAKATCIVAGMAAGADSIDDLDLLRHGAMDRAFTGARAPSTVGTFLRAFTFGHVRQLDAVSRRFLLALARATPVLDGIVEADAVTYVDIDDTMKAMYGYAQQGVGYGYNKIKGLNAQIATVSTPPGAGRGGAAPVIAAARLRKGATSSAHGAAKITGEAVATAKDAGAATVMVRADSAYYGVALIGAARKGGARFSVTARMDAGIKAAISAIPDQAWTAIKYTDAIWDEEGACWVSDAEVAEIAYTAFTSKPKAQHVAARLIVRRVKRLGPPPVTSKNSKATSATTSAQVSPAKAKAEQLELGAPPARGGVATYRFHAVFTDNPAPMLQAEATHRDHAIVESVIADLKGGALAHLPSGVFTANAAWLACAVITHNLLRATGAAVGGDQARARPASLRARLVTVPARLARTGRRLVVHLPTRWPWHHAFAALADHLGLRPTGPPAAAT